MAQDNNEKSGGAGCLLIVAAIAVIGAMVYFAHYRDAQFPSSETVRELTQRVLETIGEDTTPHTDSPEVQGKPPEERHRELKILMLNLTNQHRAAAGVPPVRLGDNPAAQLHAEEALAGCYSAHWDRWGMKPNHRYTLTGGTGADAENGFGSSYCIQPDENYSPNRPMETEVAETVQGWMDSPGHRRTLLDPAHTVLNIGIAHDRFNTNMVQHFSSDYVSYQVRPTISADGILRIRGKVSRATLEIGDSTSIQIYYDPPPRPLTQGQLADTYALCNPKKVGYVVEPLGLNQFYTGQEVRTETQEFKCVDPYGTDSNRQAPRTHDEAHQTWADAKQASSNGSSKKTEVRRIIAERLDISSSEFNIRANLAPILREHGPGIYTIMLWGRPLHISEPAPLSGQSIFWQTAPTPGHPYPIIEPPARTFAATQPRLSRATLIPTPPQLSPLPTPTVAWYQAPTPVEIKASTPEAPRILASTLATPRIPAVGTASNRDPHPAKHSRPDGRPVFLQHRVPKGLDSQAGTGRACRIHQSGRNLRGGDQHPQTGERRQHRQPRG